jgi:hypothetical protein
MAYEPEIRMSLKNEAGLYYSASLGTDGVWSVSTSSGVYYITLPQGWDETGITWMRDPNYLGIFRSMSSNGDYVFSADARAIIQYISNTEGLKGFATLCVYMRNGFEYDTLFETELDFKTYNDDQQIRMLSISTLDSKLIRDIHARADTKFNIPMWNNLGTDLEPIWDNNDAFYVLHDGIKLLYNATFTSSASDTTPLTYLFLGGYNHGRTGTGVNEGRHAMPALTQYNIVQNNGTTTFIGNTILQKFLITNNQVIGADNYIGETAVKFDGINQSQPWSTFNNCLTNYLSKDIGSIDMYVNVTGTYGSDLYASGLNFNPSSFIAFVMWEIGPGNNPAPAGLTYVNQDAPLYQPLSVGSGMIYTTIHKMYLTGATTPAFGTKFTTTIPVTIKANCCYVFGIIIDNDISSGTSLTASDSLQFSMTNLQFSFLSKYDSGASGVPVPAPYFPPSVTAAFRLHTLLEKLVPMLATTNSDRFGFPIPVTTDYEGISTYLSDPSSTAEGDAVPYQVAWTSSYCLQSLAGQPFVTVSLNELFSLCKKQFGCGAYILGNKFYIEKLTTIYDSSTMILDLGYDVAEFQIMESSDGVGANLKLGYTPADINSNFGIDSFNTELFFNTPVRVIPGTMDYQEGGVMVDQYMIELARSQRLSQPIGTAINPANPSRENSNIVLYCQPSPAPFDLPNVPTYPETCAMYDPSGTERRVTPYQLTMRDGVIYSGVPCAQNFDPTAAAAPYIANLYYPDRAINVELSPNRSLRRGMGAFIHSVLDNMDSDSLVFRNTYIMQYNNTTLALTSIESNLEIGSGYSGLVNEFSDKLVGDLPTKLFRNKKCKVLSKYPVNMYNILNTNPNGYVRFFWQGSGFEAKEYKFFIDKATYLGATKGATEFIGRFVPSQEL